MRLDKVYALKRATFGFSRALQQHRFADAIKHRRAMAHLSTDLRNGYHSPMSKSDE